MSIFCAWITGYGSQSVAAISSMFVEFEFVTVDGSLISSSSHWDLVAVTKV